MLKNLRRKLVLMLSPSEQKIVTSDNLDSTVKKKIVAGDYNPKLIVVFEKEHRVLLGLYKKVHSSATQGDSQAVKADLKKFRLLLTGHLLKENQHLYSYLFSSLKDKVSIDMTVAMKKEMDEIGKVVLSFISKYSKDDASIDSSFIPDLEEIGSALVERIRNEEQHLYPSYLPAA